MANKTGEMSVKHKNTRHGQVLNSKTFLYAQYSRVLKVSRGRFSHLSNITQKKSFYKMCPWAELLALSKAI